MRLVPVLATVTLAGLMLMSCGGGDANTEETWSWSGSRTEVQLAFSSDDFDLAGTLVLPGGTGPYPAITLSHGSGRQNRTQMPGYGEVTRRFGNAGFAVFSWDTPGSGQSTGEFAEGERLRERAQILADAIETLAEHPAIDGDRIGTWGISQAGWVMPLALDLTDRIRFMIVVSGGGEDSIEQLAFQIRHELQCAGVPPEEGELVERYFPQYAKGDTYELYVEAMNVLLDLPGMTRKVGDVVAEEEYWQPWPPEIDAYFDPMEVVRTMTIPVLAVFGELDKNVDPLQGAAAYEAALAAAGNTSSHVEVIPGIGHTMQEQSTGCLNEAGGPTSERYLALLDEWSEMLAATL